MYVQLPRALVGRVSAALRRPGAPVGALVALVLVLAGCGTGAPGERDRAAAPTQAPNLAAPAGGGDVAAVPADQVPSPTATLPPPNPTATATLAPTVAATETPTPPPTAPPTTPAAGPGPTPRPAPPPDPGTGSSRVVKYGESGRREIALTFDAGADTGYAAEILDVLAQRGVKASFGMTGVWAEENPDLVKRMVDEGHMLFNHTWDHQSFTGASTQAAPLSSEERLQQLKSTEDLVRDLTGYDLRPYFRPPYGDFDDGVLVDLANAGYTVTVMWSCDSRDSLGASGAEILINCIEGAQPGRIVLLHVGGQSAAYEVLPAMLDSLDEHGFAFVTIEEMLQP